MVNDSGANGVPVQDCKFRPTPPIRRTDSIVSDPEDSILLDAFTRYSKENNGNGLSVADQLARLLKEFDLTIKCVNSYVVLYSVKQISDEARCSNCVIALGHQG